jgi:hypothetical protein
MAISKTTSTDYTINLGPFDNGTSQWTGTMYINGNLNVSGNVTSVSDIAVDDAFIVVAANNTGTVTEMGLVAQKTASSFAGLRFDATTNAWQISSSVNFDGSPVASYANILTGGGSAFVAGANTEIQFNDSGNFGATANLAFDKSINKLTLNGHQAFGNIASTPTPVANSVVLYNKAVGAGGTGVYAVSSSVDDELVSKSKAIVFSIIF